ncbi:MAG: hypothetical protein MJZ81_06945 [Bacteroidales bacterium]|nr:hypothetical protein [Bacteroidales bacterium]
MEIILNFILALTTLLGGMGWLVERRKHKAEGEKAELDVSVIYVKEFQKHIVEPLKEEIQKNRNAISMMVYCPKYPDCPVMSQLQKETDLSNSQKMSV